MEPATHTSLPFGFFSAAFIMSSSDSFILPILKSILGPISSTSTLGSLCPLFRVLIRYTLMWIFGFGSAVLSSPTLKLIMYCNPSTSTLSTSGPLKKSNSILFASVYSLFVGLSNDEPEKHTSGFNPTVAFRKFLNCDKVRILSSTTNNSSISNTLCSKHRTNVKACGRFFECDPKRSKLASFLSEKNSREAASSKGWTSFFLLKRIARGRLREWRSFMASWTREEHFV